MLNIGYNETDRYMWKQDISEVSIKGFELALAGEPPEWVRYKIDYRYTDARYSDDVTAKIDSRIVVNVKDKRLTRVPYNKLNIDLNTRTFRKVIHRCGGT